VPSPIDWPTPTPGPDDRGPLAGRVRVYLALPTPADVWDTGRWDTARWDAGGSVVYDVTCDCEGVDLTYGRDSPTSHGAPFKASFSLRNPDGLYTPWNNTPARRRRWWIGTPVRIASPDGPLFTGAIGTMEELDAAVPDEDRLTTFTCAGPAGFLANANGLERPEQGEGELAGARLHRICDNAGVPTWVDRLFDPGVAPLQGTTLAKGALEEAWLTADSDGGVFMETPAGELIYLDANTLDQAPRYTEPQATFSDDTPYGAPPAWSPSDLTGLVAWLDASDLDELADGAPVTVWPDRSGHGHDAAAVTTPPTFHAAGVDHGPAVRFTNAATPMTVADLGAAVAGDGAYTLIVFLRTGDTSAMNVLLTAPNDGPWRFLVEFTGTYFDWGHGGGASYFGYTTSIPADSLQLWTFTADTAGSRHDLHQNGALLSVFTDWGFVPGPIPDLGADMMLGANYVHGGPLDADVAAVLWYDRALADTERLQVEQYLRDRWASTPAGTGPVHCMTALTTTLSTDNVVNQVSIAAVGLTAHEAIAPADGWAGQRTFQRHDLIYRDEEQGAYLAAAVLDRLATGELQVAPISFDPMHDTENWLAAHQLRPMDRIRVVRSRENGQQRLDLVASIDQIRQSITNLAWTTTITSSPGEQRFDFTRWDVARWDDPAALWM
jgi:hypothetical protein